MARWALPRSTSELGVKRTIGASHGRPESSAAGASDSVVALKASSGKVVWAFQAVHHNLWDYELPSGPSLIEVQRDGKRTAALAQATKMGHLFILDRDTGQPVLPVEERAVAQDGVAGEWLSPTQPFPVATPGSRSGLGHRNTDDVQGTDGWPPICSCCGWRAWEDKRVQAGDYVVAFALP